MFSSQIDPKIAEFNKGEVYNTPLVQDVWKKYFYKDEKTPDEVFKRVAHAISMSPIETESSEAYELFYGALKNHLFLPGGRILAGAGTSKRVTLMNCLAGDTELFTKEFGTKTLKELEGKTVSVLTKNGWQQAQIKFFGVQQLQKIELAPSRSNRRRKYVRATKDHRWILNGGFVTTNVSVGQRLQSCSAFIEGDRNEYRDGLFHGIVFGDGQLHRETKREVSGGYPLGTYHHVIRACGRVTEHYNLLDEYCTNYKQPQAAEGDRIYYHHGAENYKDFPSTNKSADYIQGFIDGWWIADGHYENGETQKCITSTNYKHLDWLVKHAPLGGYIITGDKVIGKKVTNLGVAKDPCRALTFLPENKTPGWEVKSITPDAIEPVYCAVVPGIHAFCLSEGLYTGNCYVNGTLEDSMEGIMAGVSTLALTSQQGGGVGTDFSPLRPENAILSRTQSAASGTLPFMDVFNQTGKTIRSAGDRRAAQMGTISDTHPDMPAFVMAKGEGLKDKSMRFAEFNLSILVSDAFLAAIEDDAEWLLYFPIPPVAERPKELVELDFVDDQGVTQYVYSKWLAADLWAMITKYTHEFSDPGVIYIDRINDLNNLQYCETIRCTNPCGEQPLPPNGTCNLGAINVANIIREPFTPNASINYELLEELAALGIRFLDNVINVTGYPLEAQKEEEYAKRRVGLGIFGLGTMFAELGVKYGSAASVNYATSVMKTICLAAYRESIRLATLRGKFPLFDDIIVDGGFISERLPQELKDSIKTNGLRNGVLLTIAPVGTGSIVFGSLSSGLEPDFAHEYERKVRSKNKEEWVTYIEKSYTKRFYEFCTKDTQTPSYMVTAQDIEILDHIKIQGALQRWVDASVSKTINVPEDIPYDKFLEVYQLAYHYGCKGCTTYRPSEWRHNILTAPSDQPEKANSPVLRPRRSTELSGTTYKIKWPSLSASMFITINYSDGLPYEIFFASKDARHSDYLTALTLMMSLILRSGIDPALVPNELQQVVSAYDGQWSDGKYFGSLVARIAETIRKDFIKHGIIEDPNTVEHGLAQKIKITEPDAQIKGEQCPQCHSYTLLKLQGCKNCTTCGYSSC